MLPSLNKVIIVEVNFLFDVSSPFTSEASEKSSRWLWNGSCFSIGVRKPGNNDRHDNYDLSC